MRVVGISRIANVRIARKARLRTAGESGLTSRGNRASASRKARGEATAKIPIPSSMPAYARIGLPILCTMRPAPQLPKASPVMKHPRTTDTDAVVLPKTRLSQRVQMT